MNVMSRKTTAPTKPASRPRTSTTSPKAVPNPSPKCYLITIPPEVRDSILRYLLLLPTGSENPSGPRNSSRSLCFTHNAQGKTRLWSPRNPNHTCHVRLPALKQLTRTCKLLYFETVALFYASNSYQFDCATCCSKILKAIGPGRRQHIKDVTFTLEDVGGGNKYPGIAAALLAQCNLKRLEINVNRNTVRTMFKHNLFRAAGVKKLREIRGCKEVVVQQVSFTDQSGRRFYHGPEEFLFTEEQVKEFEAILRGELCQEREQVREVVKEIVVEEQEE